MTTRLLVPIALLLLARVPFAAADGCPPSTCGLFGSATPGSRHAVVRTNGDRGPLRVFDVVDRRQVASLPPGLPSADGKRFVSARTVRKTTTELTTYSLPDGRKLATRTLDGRYALVAVSRGGERLVLERIVRGVRRKTSFVVVDGRRELRAFTLRGAYDVEALSPDGRRMFLIHWRRNSYTLERYDLATGRLRATPMLEDGRPEKLVGQAWRGIATRDGAWLLTLYLKGSGAFVHALDLRRGIGHCIDLPLHGQPLAVGWAAVALGPGERRLYVANPVHGRVFTIDLGGPRLVRSARFAPWLGADEMNFGLAPSAAVSPNGRMLYFNGNGLVWAYDVPYARVRGPYPARRQVMALAFTPDGRRVIAFGGDGRSASFDAATGRTAR